MFPVAGKRGKRRNCRLRERTANERNNSATPAFIRGDDARGRLVDPPASRFYRIIDFYRLLNVGCVSGKRLFLRQLLLAVLFAGNFWRFAAQLVWAKTRLVARLATFLSSAVSSLGACRLSSYLLLLSRRILQSLLGRSASLHSGRATQKLLGGAIVPAHHAKCAPLFSLPRAVLSRR